MSRVHAPLPKEKKDALMRMLGLKSKVGGDPPVPTMGDVQKSPEVPATLQGGGNPPVPKMGKQKSPAEPATLQYVGYLLKDGSRVFITREVFTKVTSQQFRENDGNWEDVTSLAFKAYEGTQEGVKSAMNTAWATEGAQWIARNTAEMETKAAEFVRRESRIAAEVERREAERAARIAAEMERVEAAAAAAKLRESQEYVDLHFQKPCARPSVFAGGRIGRSASVTSLDLTAFQEAELEDDLAGMAQRRYSI